MNHFKISKINATCLKPSRFIILVFLICLPLSGNYSQRLSRDLNVDLLINHLGYLPEAAKYCVTRGDTGRIFEVIEAQTQKVVFSGKLTPKPGDFGSYLIGEFTNVKAEGTYYIKSDTLRSYPFRVAKNAYSPAMDAILNYFSLQRCGASTTGYLTPCHLDDGVRLDNGKHKDVTGGWHDASDLRKWVSATIYGMIGLEKAYWLTGSQMRQRIIEELKWGNLYFLKMQEPDGFIMDFIGGDLLRNLDNNRWTDNEVGADGGEAKLVKPNAVGSTSLMLTMGPKDDRVIQTRPADIQTQFRFVSAEAEMYRIFLPLDTAYANKCLNAAVKCFMWGKNQLQKSENSPEAYGAAIQASIELFKSTKEEPYKEFASDQAEKLKELQAAEKETGISGFFFSSATNKEPYKQILGSTEFTALCDLILAFPSHKDTGKWKSMLANYVNNYLLLITEKNSFGLVPFGLYAKENPGGDRKAGNYWYRYFMQPELSWWVGINANVAFAAIGLAKASAILENRQLKELAQRELDWICGCNPFNSSTIVGCGYNQPERYIPSSFVPLTPVLAGAVMNGLGGNHLDQPFIGDGIWQVSEYWTPMVAATFWLMAELGNNNVPQLDK